jgi:hypothetical protein
MGYSDFTEQLKNKFGISTVENQSLFPNPRQEKL